MNGTQQVERFTAVRRLEQRQDDLSVVVEGLAEAYVAERASLTDLIGVVQQINQDLGRAVEHLRVDHAQRLAFESQTFCQRLRWLVGI